MHGSNVQVSVIADAMTIIAICTGSRTVLELAIALRAITTGKVGVPPTPENAEMVRRIARNLLDPQWNARARAALGDSKIEQVARHFYNACVTCVPTNAPDPLSDETWLMGVRALYSSEQSMQFIAEALINQFASTPQVSVPPPAPVVSAVPAPTPISTPPAPSPAEIQAKLIARLRLIARAWRFVHQFARNWKAQQACEAAARSFEQIPAPAASSAPETKSTLAQVIAPMPAHAPAPTPTNMPAIAALARAPKQNDVMRAPAPRSLYARTALPGLVGHPKPRAFSASPVETCAPPGRNSSRKQFVNTQREACGLSPP